MLWQASYNAFGEARVTQARELQPWRLAGQYYDEETGLCYVLARYYNPTLGRFLTPDPQGLAGGSLNLYTYCDGDPVNKIDPTGELAFLAIVGIIAIGAAIGALVGAGIEAWKQHKMHPDQPLDWGAIGTEAWKGAVVGAVGAGVGLLLGPVVGGLGAGLLAAAAGGAVVGGISAGIEQCVSNWLHDKPLTDGIWPAIGIGAAIGAVTAGIGGIWANRARRAAQAARQAELEAAEAARRAREAEEAARRAREAEEVARRAARETKVIVKDSKWDYFFGRVKSNPHNEARSLQNLEDLRKLGIEEANGGRERLTQLFEEGLKSPEKDRLVTQYGTTVTKTVAVPPNGAIDVKYFYPGGDMTATPEISTIIPKIFK